MPGYDCKFCNGAEKAVMLLTPLTGGDTAAVGEQCLPVAMTMLLADSLDLDMEQLHTALSREANRQIAAAAKADQAAAKPAASDGQLARPARRSGGRKAASRTEPSPAPDAGGLTDPVPDEPVGAASGQQDPG